LLEEDESLAQPELNREPITELKFDRGTDGQDDFGDFVINGMEPWYSGIGEDFIEAVQEAEERDLEGDLSKKGKRVYLGTLNGETKCCLIASRKRGKSIKLSPLLTKVSGDVICDFIEYVENDISEYGQSRKFYSHVPLLDTMLVNKFKSSGYSSEGVLRSPYKPGVDMLFLGKFPS